MLKKVHHINLLVRNLKTSVETYRRAFQLDDSLPRTGLDGWRVRDLKPETFNTATLQLTEENSA